MVYFLKTFNMLIISFNHNIIGIAAGVFTAASMLPQLVKLIKEKKAEDISLPMLLILFSGLCLWIWYGFLKKDFAIIGTNIFSLVVNILVLFFSIKYKKN
jgi:MtN3 and saliva related transmembrane protein